jgi:DNA repair exonuclease SbcCD ATPase subunit
MAQTARVTSIQSVADFREALLEFGASAQDALGAVDMQIRRAVDWLADQTKFWQVQIRKCQEDVLRARMELEQRKMENRDGRGRGSSEQEKNLRRALEKLKYAEERLANCKRWVPMLHHAIHEYQGPARLLSGALETDLKHAVALLEQKITALEAYLALAPPSAPEPMPTTSAETEVTSMAGGTPDAAPPPDATPEVNEEARAVP